MSQPRRLPAGGRIDRARPLAFRYDGKAYQGFAGDTLASALIANGVDVVARSFKYRRPRGIYSAGVEEPNALMRVGQGGRATPNLRATEVALYDGLEASSVNVFPSARFDLGAVVGLAAPALPAGFYYKTFFASPWLWNRVWEPLLRQVAGWGRVADAPDPDSYERVEAHAETVVVGGGPAGLEAALAAAEAGGRVILADEGEALGGMLLDDPDRARLDELTAKLRAMANVRLMARTTVTGFYDGRYLIGLERVTDHLATAPAGLPRQRVWHIRAGRVVLATGAHERPLVFPGNDRPGVMLAGAVRRYLRRYAVAPGRRCVIFTNNDSAYGTALDLQDAGQAVAAIVDVRPGSDDPRAVAAAARGLRIEWGGAVVGVGAFRRVRFVDVRAADGGKTRIPCDLVAVSGGFSPAVHLFSQAQGKLLYDDALACLKPGDRPAGVEVAGSAAGGQALRDCVGGIAPCWRIPGTGKAFVDLQNDTTAADVALAAREGFRSVEHMKRYTLAGFGTDQGKTGNLNALAILAQETGRTVGEVGVTTFRAPYTPVTFAAMAGPDRGALFDPVRQTAMHDRHVAGGAVFEDVGQWKRPRYYPRPGEDMDAAVRRECAAVREAVGMLDASTLGKIDIQGPDAAEFLNRVYINGWKTLAVGRVRYGVMCHEDGMVFDDGTTARLAENRYLMTTTSGGAAGVLDHLEDYLQTEWPDLRVRLASVTEQWATVAIQGPKARAVLAALTPGLDLAADAFPMLTWRDATVAGLSARVFRISFTGELSYEVNVPWLHGAALWDAVAAAGATHGIAPYGTEAMHVLRAEKGFVVVGHETDGTVTPLDLGMGRMVSTKKDFIGRRSLDRPAMRAPGRLQLVGLLAEGGAVLAEGSQLVAAGDALKPPPVAMQGYITSSYWSVALGRPICLALVKDGAGRHGERIEAALPGRAVGVEICAPVFLDPEGRRLDGDA